MNRMTSGAGRIRDSRGATLVELMIGMVISIIMMGAVAMAVQTQSKSTNRETARIDLIHNLQNAAIRVEKDLRMAGYQTVDTSNLHVGAITAANPGDMTFLYDTDDNSGTGDAKGRESLTLRIDQAGDAGFDADHPRLALADAGGIFPIGSDITGVSFEYYDVDGAVTAVLDDIRSVKITINGRSARVNPDTGSYITGSLTIRVTPRNFG